MTNPSERANVDEQAYTQLKCQYDKLAALVCDQCKCWSTYLSELDHGSCDSECSFLDHINCVKDLISTFDPTESDDCLPSCLSTSFKQESIQYTRIAEKFDDSILFIIEYKNLAKLINEEVETYTAAKFQSDLGRGVLFIKRIIIKSVTKLP